MTSLPVPTTGVQVDREAVLRSLNLNPSDPKTQALLLVCERYGLDPLLKHMVLIQGSPYVTRDGYLAIAHRSGEFDGMEVLEQGADDTHYLAKVAVFRKDMSHPFAFVGRFPKSKSMAKEYGPEMAVKVAEVAALRRAFNVTGISAADEQWSDAPADPATGEVRALPAFTSDDETLIDMATQRDLCIRMSEAFPGRNAAELDDLRHAIVHYATKGRTTSSKAVTLEEWPRVEAVFTWARDGKLVEQTDGGNVYLAKPEHQPA